MPVRYQQCVSCGLHLRLQHAKLELLNKHSILQLAEKPNCPSVMHSILQLTERSNGLSLQHRHLAADRYAALTASLYSCVAHLHADSFQGSVSGKVGGVRGSRWGRGHFTCTFVSAF